jgi:uncharacterized Zn finger protein
MSGKKKTIESVLKDKTEAQLRQLLIDISRRFPDTSDFILRWSNSKGQIDVAGELAMALWKKAEVIIDQFNEYGGGPDDDEEAACEYICEMGKLIPKLSWEARQKIVDRMLEQYSYGNSGFEDMLIEACYKMCSEKDELVYLAEQFLSFGRFWDKRRAMAIYRRIGEGDKYLQIRASSLEFANDYLDLAEYYEEQGDIETALEVAKKGLRKGEGSMKQLLLFMFDCYEQRNDTIQLEELKQFCEAKNVELETIYSRLHEYYKAGNDYENAKIYLLKHFDNFGRRELDKKYAEIKGYLKQDDWNVVEERLFASIKERDLEGYLQICLKKGLNREVCDIIMGMPIQRYGPWGSDYDYFADKLMKAFPDEIIKYYWARAIALIESGKNRDNYKNAIPYFKKVKSIYVKIQKNTPLWERKLAEIRATYPKRKALMEEIRVLE